MTHPLQYFYEEQLHRMECLSQESVSFTDVLAQMSDMLEPAVRFCHFTPSFPAFHCDLGFGSCTREVCCEARWEVCCKAGHAWARR